MSESTDRPDAALIPTGFDPGSYSCVRSLSRRGVRTIVASEFEDVPAAASRFCDEQLQIPSPHDDLLAYRDALLGTAAREDVQTIFPLRPQDQYLFAKYREEFEQYVSLVTPPMETLNAVLDRTKLIDAAEAAGVPAPETRRLSDVDDWADEQIVKSRYNLLAEEYDDSYSPRESEIVKDVTHLQPGERPEEGELREEMGHDPIVQEYVRAADEYVVGALYDHGEALATFQHRQIRGDSYTGGGGVYREAVDIPELERVARDLLDHLDWHGLACIEYMEDADTGEFKIAEINPRLWQSLPCAVRAGADFPHDYWLQATGRADEVEPGYEVGVGSHLLYGEIGHLMSVLRDDSPLVDRPSVPARAAEIAASCLRMPNFDNLRTDDPLPFLRGFRHVVKSKR